MKRFLKWLLIVFIVIIAGVGFAYWTPDTDAAAMRAKYGGPTSQFVDVGGGLTVHLRDEGPRDAPVVMLLHGSNSSLHTWDDWTKHLTPNYRVVRFDQIGHGLTGPNPAGKYDAAAFTDTVDRVAAKLGIGRFVLVGNSMGGSVAWHYAERHPGRLRGLVLVDSSGQPEGKPTSLPIGFRIARTPVLRDVMRYLTPRSMIEKSLHQSVSNQSVVTDAAVDRYWELLRYPGNRQATIDRFSTPPEPATINRIACLTVPTLILWGAEDKLIPVSSAEWFAAHIPENRVIVYPATGHLPMEEVAGRSATDLSNWLATLPPPR